MEIYATIEAYVKTHGVELGGRALAALAIVAGSLILARLARVAVAAALAARAGPQRAATLAPAVQSLTRVTVLGAGIIMALHQLGLNVATVLAGAGVVGIAVGFGAQTLVRDVISGFFLISDGVIEAGDHVTFNQVSGVVEEIGLRMTQIRSLDGRLWYVPNAQLDVVGNSNRDWCRAIVRVPLPYEQDVAAGLQIVQQVGDTWAEEHSDIVIEPPEAQGVLSMTAEGVEVRLVAKVRAMEHWVSERELARRIKEALEAHGVDSPFPRQVVYHRGGSTPHTGTSK